MSSATFAGNARWARGTAVVVAGSPALAVKQQAFPGIDGEYELNEGRRAAGVVQTGVLHEFASASATTNLANLKAALNAIFGDVTAGTVGALVDDYGRAFAGCRMASFAPGRIRRAAHQGHEGYYCTYRIEYVQASGVGAS
jgi:hypothetical protein